MNESTAFQPYDGWDADLARAVCAAESSDGEFDDSVARLKKAFEPKHSEFSHGDRVDVTFRGTVEEMHDDDPSGVLVNGDEVPSGWTAMVPVTVVRRLRETP